MSLQTALRLLRGARAAETIRVEATPDGAERSAPPEGPGIDPSTPSRSEPRRPSKPERASPSPLPSASDPEGIRWQKLLALRTGSGMGSVIWDAARPRGDRDRGDDRAPVRDGFSRRVWRE
jgi:hypothetical protein